MAAAKILSKSKPAPAPKPTNPTPFDYVPPSIKPSKAKRSYYHEALAFVLRVSPVSPSTYTILVVPRLDETLAESGVRSPCGPELGNELLLMDGKNGVDRAKLEELMCKGMHFERGLRVEEVDRRNITTLSKPPSSHEVALFLASEHGHVVASFPRVEQWAFEEGEEVTDWNGTFRGRILTVRDNGLEVQVLRRYADLSGSELEEIVFLGWAAFKQWHVGSYVRHTGGKEGIVVGSEGDNILFWMGGEGGDEFVHRAHRNTFRVASKRSSIDGVLTRRRENVTMEALRLTRRRENVTMEALRLSNMSEAAIIRAMGTLNSINGFVDPQLMTPAQIDNALAITKTFGNPWKFWSVLVWKGMHRGFYHVIDLIVSRETKSGLKLQVRTDVANAVGNLLLVDYDQVVDAE
ncbi:hypothetical protein PQX77_021656 [Marasmius sp. AFHP31]|nr:hypothetical protein PQX77_021656 [Marasmius sp. AFHP31]